MADGMEVQGTIFERSERATWEAAALVLEKEGICKDHHACVTCAKLLRVAAHFRRRAAEARPGSVRTVD